MDFEKVNGHVYARMINSAASSLKAEAEKINNLNVFPIPDGDTGDNMLLTILGGVGAVGEGSESIAEASRATADGMLLSARGNSGVILSQFFDGIAAGFEGVEDADRDALVKAFSTGVVHAYKAVLDPCEGTILTVARCAAEAAAESRGKSADEILRAFITEAKSTLKKTPDMLPVLKKAGVVDSGGAGLIYIMEGMLQALDGDAVIEPVVLDAKDAGPSELDLDKFDENSVLEYGYCTEFLLRLQNAKCDALNFDVSVITDYLTTIGDSLVAFKTGTIVKVHVHTMTPDKVLAFCQQYGEFLKIKIENMSLQHNNATLDVAEGAFETKERTKFGVVSALAGDGVKAFFKERGCDVIVDGGQSMNPSTEDFLRAFKEANADCIFVLPNNSNIILTAKQAAGMFEGSDVRVIESRSVGEGFAALTMYSPETDDADAIEAELREAMEGVICAEVSKSIRDTDESVAGDYIGFVGKDILSDNSSRIECAFETVQKAGLADHDFMVVLFGAGVSDDEAAEFTTRVSEMYRSKEIYTFSGGQEVFDYIMIIE